VPVRITQPMAGIVRLDNISSVRKERIGKLAGRADADAMEAVSIALRAALDL
jgi:mRNA-degrading endonuclease toxin of MazEF toxin-antitoxin module